MFTNSDRHVDAKRILFFSRNYHNIHTFLLDVTWQQSKLHDLKTAQFQSEKQRQNACDSLNTSHLVQFMTEASLTFLEFVIIKVIIPHKNLFLLVFHLSVLSIQFCQMLILNIICKRRSWRTTFMVSDMETVRYTIHYWSYVAYTGCYSVCFVTCLYMWVFNWL